MFGQMRDALGVAEHGLSSLQELSLFWQKVWGMPNFLSFGLVPLQEHLALIRRYEEAKERVAAHEETIKHLRLLLESKGCEPEEPQTGLQDVMRSQVNAFFAIMRSMQFFPYK